MASQGTELHDHGGSRGAFAVAAGTLTELIPSVSASGASLSELRRHAGDSAAFGSRHVHDVVNAHPQPAVSVHAYSPPLSSMSYYHLDPDGLHVTRVLDTDDPEA